MTTAEQLAALRATVEAFMAHSKEAQERMADAHHQVAATLAPMKQDIEILKSDMKEVKPVAKAMTSIQSVWFGITIVVGALGFVAMTVLNLFKDKILHALGWGV